MQKIISWIKTHKLVTALIVIIAFMAVRDGFQSSSFVGNTSYIPDRGTFEGPMPLSTIGSMGMEMGGFDAMMGSPKVAAPAQERIVVQNSHLSLLVKNVQQASDLILKKTEEAGGFMINRRVSDPDNQGSATIEVRVPADKLPEILETFRAVGIKVVSENLEGTDLTEQYSDLQARRETLLATKAKFEKILDAAVRVTDILEVQREIINLQAQIDSLTGQERYIKESARLAKVTIYLGTDEISLPYMPVETWSPETVLKEAVRSLVGLARTIANALIWVMVYGVIWIPVGVVYLVIKRARARKKLN